MVNVASGCRHLPVTVLCVYVAEHLGRPLVECGVDAQCGAREHHAGPADQPHPQGQGTDGGERAHRAQEGWRARRRPARQGAGEGARAACEGGAARPAAAAAAPRGAQASSAGTARAAAHPGPAAGAAPATAAAA